jgi:hypothetical protein
MSEALLFVRPYAAVRYSDRSIFSSPHPSMLNRLAFRGRDLSSFEMAEQNDGNSRQGRIKFQKQDREWPGAA